jgi:hypothetical protein
MFPNYPTDKYGFILCLDDLVIIPKGKHSRKGHGRVAEILSHKTVRLKVDEHDQPVFGEYLVIHGNKLVNILWRRNREKLANPLKERFINTCQLYPSIKHKSPEVRNHIINLIQEFDKCLEETQLVIHQNFKKLNHMAGQLFQHRLIIEPSDVVIWSDAVSHFYNPFLCKIVTPVYTVTYKPINKNMKPSAKEYTRYEGDAGILFKFSEAEFNQLVEINNIKSPQQFILYAKNHCKPFADDEWTTFQISCIK